MVKVSDKTIERYASVWNKIQASGLPLTNLDKINFNQFKNKTNINSESQFRLAKGLARNPERQRQVNQYFNKKGIPKTIIKRTPIIQAIPKVRKVKPKAKPKVKVKPKPKVKAKSKAKPKVKAKPPKPPKPIITKPKRVNLGNIPRVKRKESEYGVIEVIDDTGTSYWIKYESNRDFNRQLDILKQFYPITKMNLRSHGFRAYREFTDSEFQKELTKFLKTVV